MGETTVIDLEDGYEVRFGPETIEFDVPGYGLIRATPDRRKGIQAELPEGDVPAWINVSKNRMAVKTPNGRLTVTRNRAEVFRYFAGWELFFFTLDSPYHGQRTVRSFAERRAIAGESGAIWQDFWTNKMWRHQDVAWAIGETLLMAFLGTFGGAMIALPLAFLGTRNFMPVRLIAHGHPPPVRFCTRCRQPDLDRGSGPCLWPGTADRCAGDSDHRHRHLRQDLLGSAGKR